jgi:RNA polymerase sigma-70 factor (ECF subfamily)
MKPYGDFSDEELYQAFSDEKKTAEGAFAEFYQRYSGKLYGYCVKLLGYKEDLKDIYQDIFLKFFNSAQERGPMDNPRAYLFRIAHNICANYIRDRKETVSYEEYFWAAEDNTTKYEDRQLVELINDALNKIESGNKEAFVLRMYEGLSYKEIAEIQDTSETLARNRVWRAKEKIKKILDPYLKEVSLD